MQKKIVGTIVILLTFFNLFSQQSTDENFIFKMWLFIEKANVGGKELNTYPIKDSSLFRFFYSNIQLKLDTLNSTGFSTNYTFLSLSTKTQDTSNISILKNKGIKGNLAWYLFFATNCDQYVICINKESGISYRLKGFKGNDLLSLLNETKNYAKEMRKENLSDKSFLDNYRIDGLDLKCIYQGLKSKNFGADKFPCLKPCDYGIFIIH